MKYRINKQKIVNDSDSIRVLDLPERLFDILNSYNVTTISQLKALSWDTVEQLKGIGMASQIKVMSVVSQLKQAEKEIEEKKEDILKTLDIQTKNSNSSKKTEKHSAITTPMIFHIYQKYHLEEMDFHLYENRNCISKNGIQLFSINDDQYKICFTNSNIHEQIELDRINEEFGIDVHFGKDRFE